MTGHISRSHVAVFACLVQVTAVAVAYGQGTIPEAVAATAKPITRVATVPSGVPPTLKAVLSEADLVVQTSIGEGVARLSSDERDIITTYVINNPTVLWQRVPRVLSAPGPTSEPLRIILLGGEMTIGGLEAKSEHMALPLLKPGCEYVLALKSVNGAYQVAGTYYGVFEFTSDGRLVPTSRKEGFAASFKDRAAPASVTEIVTTAGEIHRH